MLRLSLLVLLALPLALPSSAFAFGPAGPWDSVAFDSALRPTASIGAAIAAASALANSRAGREQDRRPASSGPTVSNSCSLDIASLSSQGRGPNASTIVLQADIRAPIIQVCR